VALAHTAVVGICGAAADCTLAVASNHSKGEQSTQCNSKQVYLWPKTIVCYIFIMLSYVC